MAQGPLAGLRIVEFAGMGPSPFCAMLLADLGADIVRIERLGAIEGGPADILLRGRQRIGLDLRSADGVNTARRIVANVDALVEGFRPGVMERLGLGPDLLLAQHPSLVYVRITGWGQDGPLADRAGHDLNYIALTGALDAIGPVDRPLPPLNLVGDYAGGGLYGAFGMLAALLHARATGEGQVVDCAMVDGAASLMSTFWGLRAKGEWRDRRVANTLDGGAPFYDCYRCSDGEFISVAAIEPQFYAALLDRLGMEDDVGGDRRDPANWPAMRERLTAAFASRSRDEWTTIFEGTDACVAPVLGLGESPGHAHMAARHIYCEVDGVTQPAPVPRFAKTPGVATAVQPRCDPRSLGESWLGGLEEGVR